MGKLLRLLAGLLALLLVAMLVSYFWVRAGLEELDVAARQQVGGNYFQSDYGSIAYTRHGSAEAPPVVLVHGFSTPKFVWQQVVPILVDAGYQVLTYDHLGRGFSERPAGPYDDELYRTELSSLIQELGLVTPLTLVGYSMGGANVVDFAVENPSLIAQLVLIAPAGYMGQTGARSWLWSPVLGEWFTTVFGRRYARDTIANKVAEGLAPPHMLEQFDEQASYHG
ncbi:MAG: alpha/beta fold hydrolase, partial [Pseudomonadota bacterium]